MAPCEKNLWVPTLFAQLDSSSRSQPASWMSASAWFAKRQWAPCCMATSKTLRLPKHRMVVNTQLKGIKMNKVLSCGNMSETIIPKKEPIHPDSGEVHWRPPCAAHVLAKKTAAHTSRQSASTSGRDVQDTWHQVRPPIWQGMMFSGKNEISLDSTLFWKTILDFPTFPSPSPRKADK